MKKLMFCMLFLGFVIQGNSQIELKETRINYKPVSMKIDPVSNSMTVKLSETKAGEFSQDPLGFLKNNFDISRLVAENRDSDFTDYEVIFESRKGRLRASFDKEGNLTSSFQRFKNVPLPDEVRLEALRNFKDGQIVKNRYTANSKGWQIINEHYVLRIRDGVKMKKLKIKKYQGEYVVAVL